MSYSKNPIKLQKAYMLTVLIAKYYETEHAGGCCHILLDDGNYGMQKSCLIDAIENNDFFAETIARMLDEFTEEEQEQIVERPHEIEMEMEFN